MARKEQPRHKTGTPGIYWRGTDKARRYEVTWRCYGTCEKHAEKGQGQHWERARGDYSDAIKFLEAKKREVEDLRARRDRGEDIRPAESRTFGQVTDEYLASRSLDRLAPGTKKKYREALDLRALPKFKDVPIDKITTDDLAEFLDELRSVERIRRRGDRTEGLSESTINGALTPVRAVFKFAAARQRRYVAVNPVDALEPDELPSPEADKRPVQVLDEADLARVVDAATWPFDLMFDLDGNTGLRSAELRALTWPDFDFDNLRVKVSRQIDADDVGERVAIKDRALTEYRWVPFTQRIGDRLLDHKAKMAEHGLARDEHFVFGGDKHVKHGKLDDAFRAAVKKAGVVREEGKRLSLHSLRHSYGSLLIASGESLAAVSAWLGHRKLSTTERWYVHQIESLLDVAAERMRQRAAEREAAAT